MKAIDRIRLLRRKGLVHSDIKGGLESVPCASNCGLSFWRESAEAEKKKAA